MTDKTWQQFPFLVKTHKQLESLYFERPRIVLSKGNPKSWDEFGIRDPALLVNENGFLVYEKGAIVLYYTGSHNKGLWQGTGRALSFDQGNSWQREPQNPVLAPRKGEWDGFISSTAWVIKNNDGIYRMYYRGANVSEGDDAIGLATSRDGIHFDRKETNPILTSHDFKGMRKAPHTFMGVINVVRLLDGQYLLTFEGSSIKHEGKAQIFAAISKDGEKFEAFNDGYPIFTSDDVHSWPVKRVANPRIVAFEETYMLAFNGHYESGLYAIGLAFTKDFKTWWEHPANPVLLPSGAIGDPFSGRLEGGVIVKEDITKGKGAIRQFIMAIPRQAYSHQNAVVGLSLGHFDQSEKRYAFSRVADQVDDVRVIEGEILQVCKSMKSRFAPRAIFMISHQRGIFFEFKIEKNIRDSALVTFGKEIDSAVTNDGIALLFKSGTIYCKNKTNKKFFERFLKKLIGAEKGKYWFGWNLIGTYKLDNWSQLVLKKKKKTWEINLNDQKSLTVECDLKLINSISMESLGGKLNIRNLQILK